MGRYDSLGVMHHRSKGVPNPNEISMEKLLIDFAADEDDCMHEKNMKQPKNTLTFIKIQEQLQSSISSDISNEDTLI